MLLYTKKTNIYPAYVSKYNSNHEKGFVISMISNQWKCKPKSKGGLWNYLAVKTLSALLRGVTSKTMVIFIVWIDFISLKQEPNLNCMKEYVRIKISVMYAFWRH